MAQNSHERLRDASSNLCIKNKDIYPYHHTLLELLGHQHRPAVPEVPLRGFHGYSIHLREETLSLAIKRGLKEKRKNHSIRYTSYCLAILILCIFSPVTKTYEM